MKKSIEERRKYFRDYYHSHKPLYKKSKEGKENNIKEYQQKYYQTYKVSKKENLKEYRQMYYKNNKEFLTQCNYIRSLKREYNITPEEYNTLFINQKGCCAICGRHQSELKQKLFVDHDHNTNAVRGLLCIKCNFALGYMNDDTALLESAIKYLNNNE